MVSRILAAALVLLGVAGCGGGADEGSSVTTSSGSTSSARQEAVAETVTPSHCPGSLPSCRSAEGRIVYVERVDPDGDGDAHFVIADRQGITLPGLTAIDVRKGLRPHPLPGPGALISAAGPVQTGSLGQSQIHALELHVARP
ncbi:MAG TPA: hypothetical protein VFM94_07550 [Solirubrobacterales bacterium]|nr:hypothetical protein [Solirubrobacterales bacterium]